MSDRPENYIWTSEVPREPGKYRVRRVGATDFEIWTLGQHKTGLMFKEPFLYPENLESWPGWLFSKV